MRRRSKPVDAVRRGEQLDAATRQRILNGVFALPLTATLIALGIPAIAMAQTGATSSDAGTKAEAPKNAAELSTLNVTADSLTAITNPTSNSATGFAKPILETPRSISFIDQDQLNTLGISTVQDLVRAVPGTYTTTRYGLQGGINVRGVQADVYWRGMKRLTMQGHERTDLNGMDGLEVVEGPPSPIYGLGEMGGYVNELPKSSRASTGTYLSDIGGFAQGKVGSYETAEAQVGAGGPLQLGDKHGGYYVFALLDNSNTYIDKVVAHQKLFQATSQLDHFIGPFRLETGVQYQNSQTSGAFVNRVTQDLITKHLYVTGNPLVDLRQSINPAVNPNGPYYNPSNYNGIGFRETHINSPLGSTSGQSVAGGCGSLTTNTTLKGCAQPYSVTSLKLGDGTVAGLVGGAGSQSVINEPLSQTYQWPYNPATKQFYKPGHFPQVPGIPPSMLAYLTANPGADPTGALRKAGALGTGPVPISGWLPAGMVLDPRTTGYSTPAFNKDGSFERLQNANLYLLYYDLVYDTDPNFTIKNQIFSDNVEATKDSYLPYGEYLEQHLFEDKMTITHTVPTEYLPSWLTANTLASLNYRITHAAIRDGGGDFDWRQDMKQTQGNDVQLANNNFANPLNNASYFTGAINSANNGSWYNDFGAGVLFDIAAFKNTDLVIGGRWDGSKADASNYTRNNEAPNNAKVTSYTIANSATQVDPSQTVGYSYAAGWSHGTSESASLSQQLPFGLRPYVTLARSAIILEDSNNIISTAALTSATGHIGSSKMKEGGIKGSWLDGRATFTTAFFSQARTDISQPSDPTATSNVSSTKTRGWENQFKWQVTRKLSVGAYSLWESSNYIYESVSSIVVNSRILGFQDVMNPSGAGVLYPAEAFVYGGKTNINIPAALASQYNKLVGIPDHQYGWNASYTIGHGFSVHMDGNWFQAVWADRIKTVQLPHATTIDMGVQYDMNRFHIAVNGYNITNIQYFRAGIGDTDAELVSAMPRASFEVKTKIDF